MKQLFPIVIFLLSIPAFAQIQSAPERYSKVHFVYETKSNIEFDENGFYADSAYLGLDFPKISFQKVAAKSDKSKSIGFIAYSSLKKKDLKRLRGIAYNDNRRTEVEYDVVKNQAIYRDYHCVDENIKKVFSKYFKKNCADDNHWTMRDFLPDGSILVNTPTYKWRFLNENRKIIWAYGMKYTGIYKYQHQDYAFQNIVVADPKLGKLISILFPFENCEYGIAKEITLYTTTEMVSVIYQ